ncbi:MAG: replicative DNA helicase [Burkholderiales bacterium]|nr:replicative DNA helicase [Burkholderiales bacterium]
MAEAFNAEGKDATELLDSAEKKVLAVSEQLGQASSSFISLKHAIKNVQEEIDELKKNPLQEGQTRGISTGFVDIDRMTDGLHPGQLIIIAGRPSMGKTAFALNIAANVARNSLPVGIFSLEMRAEELAIRLISAVGHIPQDELKSGKISENNWTRFYDACEELVADNINMQIDPSSTLTLFNIRSRARQLKVRCGKLGLLVVDYLQLMSSDNSRANENRATEVATISRGLKTLARELEVPVIALSQLSRKVEERRDSKRPMMSDLRESGAIEQDADVIIFLHREAVYELTPENEKEAEVIIGKQRSGPTGIIEMVYEGQFTLFLNKAREEWTSNGQE